MWKKIVCLCLIVLLLNINYVKAEGLDCSNTLRRGDTGNSVRKLQRRLNEVMDCNLDVDGVFGRKTYACVVKFEKKYKLGVDGVVGKETCGKLNKDLNGISDNSVKLADGNYLAVIKSNTKIYSSRTTSASVLKRADLGEVFKYVEGDSNYYKIEINDGYGYIKTNNIRTSFILVDISDQTLKYMKHNEVVVNTSVVTGMMDKHDTPVGYYTVRKANKQRGRTLRGTNDNGSKYSAYVEYWMPFITSRGIGFHDASWRGSSEFNDSTYMYDGSHGCVNMPSSEAKKLYKALTYDEDVIVRD